jgi:hypothetical protein
VWKKENLYDSDSLFHWFLLIMHTQWWNFYLVCGYYLLVDHVFIQFSQGLITNALQLPMAVAFPSAYWNAPGFWLDIGGKCGALLLLLEMTPARRRPRVLLLGANYVDEVIPLSLTLLVCYPWLLQMVFRCVLLGFVAIGKIRNDTSWLWMLFVLAVECIRIEKHYSWFWHTVEYLFLRGVLHL